MPHSVHVEKVAQDVILNERPSTDCEGRRNVDARHCRNTSLVIHMGLPKTGTTFLQNHVFSPFDQIADFGKTPSYRADRPHVYEALEIVASGPEA